MPLPRLNTLGDKNLNLLLTTVVIAYILCLKCTIEGIYRNSILDILENIFLVNLMTVSAVAPHIHDGEKLSAVTNTSIGIAFLMFIVILSYHTYKYIVKPRCQKWLISVQKCLSSRHNCKSHQELPQIAVDDKSTDLILILILDQCSHLDWHLTKQRAHSCHRWRNWLVAYKGSYTTY